MIQLFINISKNVNIISVLTIKSNTFKNILIWLLRIEILGLEQLQHLGTYVDRFNILFNFERIYRVDEIVIEFALEKRVRGKVTKESEDVSKTHLQQICFENSKYPQTYFSPPFPSLNEETIPHNPNNVTLHLAPKSYNPWNQEVLNLHLFV
jgi:hypothetical protein